MRKFFMFLLLLAYFEAGIGTMVWYNDQVCVNSERPNRCIAAAIGTGAAWPAYWSTIAWRIALYDQGIRDRLP